MGDPPNRMTRSYPEWAYLIDESGRYWYHLKNGTRIVVDGTEEARPPQRAIYGIPTNDLVSHPHWISSKDEEIRHFSVGNRGGALRILIRGPICSTVSNDRLTKLPAIDLILAGPS